MDIRTAFNGKVATTIQDYSGLCVPCAVVSSSQFNSTVLDGKITVVIEHDEVAGRIIGNVDCLAVKINSDLIVRINVVKSLSCISKVAFHGDVREKRYSCACLCSCDCICEG